MGAIKGKWWRCFTVGERKRVHHASESWDAIDASIREQAGTPRVELAPDDDLPVGPMLSHRWKIGAEPAVAVGSGGVLILVPLGGSSRARDECGNGILRAARRNVFVTFMLRPASTGSRARKHQCVRQRCGSRASQRTTVGSALPEAERSAAITEGVIPEGYRLSKRRSRWNRSGVTVRVR